MMPASTPEIVGNADMVPMPMLAAIWVDRWLAYGGSLLVDSHRDGVALGMRERRYDEAVKSTYLFQHFWRRGWNVGRWRELSDLSALIPGLHDAIIRHVELNGTLRADGSIAVYESPGNVGAERQGGREGLSGRRP